MAIPRTTSPINKAPSLSEILDNTAPPPWTLSAFMAYLSQNHCLETLEFVLDADRYRAAYARAGQAPEEFGSPDICVLWRKVIDAYIMPCSPREVNLPAHVRDRLLQLECSSHGPPHPSELDEAVQIVHELMNDSVLVPFLESFMPQLTESQMEEEAQESRQVRTRLRISREASFSGDEASQSPKNAFLPLLGINRPAHRPISTSTDLSEADLVTDDSSPNSTPGVEPITPPTTPPMSDFAHGGSPNTFQRAMSGNSWKKMGAKLGLSRKSKNSRRSIHSNTSVSADMHAPPAPETVNQLPL